MNATKTEFTKVVLLMDYPIPEQIVADLALVAGLSLETARAHARELEKFLIVCAESDRPLAPSPAVDTAWHDFILHTQEYSDFCRNNFGRFIHHAPKRGLAAAGIGAYVETLRALTSRFGAVDHAFWPSTAAFLQEVCDSGGGGGGKCSSAS